MHALSLTSTKDNVNNTCQKNHLCIYALRVFVQEYFTFKFYQFTGRKLLIFHRYFPRFVLRFVFYCLTLPTVSIYQYAILFKY